MSSQVLIAVLIFAGGALLLIVIMLRLFGLRGTKDESEGSIDHTLGLGMDEGPGAGGDGD